MRELASAGIVSVKLLDLRVKESPKIGPVKPVATGFTGGERSLRG
jgi:hypothetical protein